MKTNVTKQTSKPMDNKPIIIKSAPNRQKADSTSIIIEPRITSVIALPLAPDAK
jgi:hypothetical protein